MKIFHIFVSSTISRVAKCSLRARCLRRWRAVYNREPGCRHHRDLGEGCNCPLFDTSRLSPTGAITALKLYCFRAFCSFTCNFAIKLITKSKE